MPWGLRQEEPLPGTGTETGRGCHSCFPAMISPGSLTCSVSSVVREQNPGIPTRSSHILNFLSASPDHGAPVQAWGTVVCNRAG